MRRGPAVVLLLALLVSAAFGAQRAAVMGWKRLTEFAPAYITAQRPVTGTPPVANRLVLILVDGLRPEDAPMLPSLEWLRGKGSGIYLSVPAPAYGAPALTTLLTGAPPSRHGVVLDAAYQSLRADTLAAVAIRMNMSVGAAGPRLLGTLLGQQVRNWQEITSGAEGLVQARGLLAPTGPRLVLLQTDLLHTEAHRLGTSSPATKEYRQRLAEVDAQLVQLIGGIDLKTTAVLISGTMPTDPGGKHPADGTVPLIMAGAGVREGYRGNASLTDVAPTAAVLLGAPVPLQASGRPLMEALTVQGRPADLVAQRHAAGRKSFTDVVLVALGRLDLSPDPPGTAPEVEPFLDALDQQVRQARFEYTKAALMRRLPWVGGGILLGLIYLLISVRQPFGGATTLGVLAYLTFFHLSFFLVGGRYSANMAGLEGLNSRVAAGLGLRVALSMIAATAVTAYFLSRKPFRQTAYLAGAVLHSALTAVTVVALPVGVTVLLVGWDFPAGLPATGLMVWFFVTCAQVAVIGYLSPLLALLAVWLIRLCRRIWPPKEVGNPEHNADRVVRMRSLRRSRGSTPRRI